MIMLGGLGAYIASEVSGTVRRNVTIYGLYGFAGLLVVCAAGYALNAVHTVLTLRYGPVEASLWVAGGLSLAALLALSVALYVKNRRRPTRSMGTAALVAAPVAAQLLGSRKSWRVALLGGVVVLGALIGRQLLSGGEDTDA